MKKLLALVMALMLALPGIALAEPAEDGEVTFRETYNWEDVDPAMAALADSLGAFVTLEDLGLKMWIPEELAPVEPQGEGTLYAFFSEEMMFGVRIFLEPLPDDVDANDMAALAEYFVSAKAENVASVAAVNGFPCIIYYSGTEECLAFRLDDGSVVTFAFDLQNEDDWSVPLYFQFMYLSIQKADD